MKVKTSLCTFFIGISNYVEIFTSKEFLYFLFDYFLHLDIIINLIMSFGINNDAIIIISILFLKV